MPFPRSSRRVLAASLALALAAALPVARSNAASVVVSGEVQAVVQAPAFDGSTGTVRTTVTRERRGDELYVTVSPR